MPEINKIFDTDHHWMPAPDTFTSRISKKYGEFIPHVEKDDAFGEVWVFNGGTLRRAFGLENVGGAEPKDYGWKCTYETMSPGFWKAKDRIKAMDADGITVALQFPSVSSYALTQDDDLYLQVIQAYNDAIWDWAQEGDGARILPGALVPVGLGNEVAINELFRAKKKGFIHMAWSGLPRYRLGQTVSGQAMFGGVPTAFGATSTNVPTREDDPFFAAIQETGMIISDHGAQPRQPALKPGEAPKKAARSVGSVEPQRQGIGGRGSGAGTANRVGEFIMSGIFERFPQLKYSLIETSAGWMPSFVEQLDDTFLKYRQLGELPISKLPSEYAKEFLYPVDIELQGIKYRHLIGVNNVTVGTDYPHFGTRYPHTRWYFDLVFSGVPQDEVDKITWGNAAKFYGIN